MGGWTDGQSRAVGHAGLAPSPDVSMGSKSVWVPQHCSKDTSGRSLLMAKATFLLNAKQETRAGIHPPEPSNP